MVCWSIILDKSKETNCSAKILYLRIMNKYYKSRLITLKEQIRTSLEEHDSKFIALVGHHDCTDNLGDRAFQENQMDEALDYLQRAFGTSIKYVGLYVNEHWEVEEYTCLEPSEQD